MNYEKFKDLFEKDWGYALKPFIESQECDKIYAYLRKRSKEGHIILPDPDRVWQAFHDCPFSKIRVVVLLQDPYPWVKNGIAVANGIAMDCSNTGHMQPSLIKFYEGIEDDLSVPDNKPYRDCNLRYLSEQGVLLLNTSLTVEKNKPSSHFDLWKPFMKYLMEDIFAMTFKGLVFILCGKNSEYFERFINPLQHYILKCEHPAAAEHQLRPWNHNAVFSKTNRILVAGNGYGINWLPILMRNEQQEEQIEEKYKEEEDNRKNNSG